MTFLLAGQYLKPAPISFQAARILSVHSQDMLAWRFKSFCWPVSQAYSQDCNTPMNGYELWLRVRYSILLVKYSHVLVPFCACTQSRCLVCIISRSLSSQVQCYWVYVYYRKLYIIIDSEKIREHSNWFFRMLVLQISSKVWNIHYHLSYKQCQECIAY